MSDVWEAEYDDEEDRLSITSVRLGMLAMVPLFVFYEWGLTATHGTLRNSAEVVLGLPLLPLGSVADAARRLILLAVLIACFLMVRSREWSIGRATLRVMLEGVLGAVVLGPLLLFLVNLVGDGLPRLVALPSAEQPGLAHLALLGGGAAYEELLFRVLGYGLIYLVINRAMQFVTSEEAAGISAEVTALIGSSLLFAGFHLQGWLAYLPVELGEMGEPFEAVRFAWRTAAGILLGLIFRWRGVGVAAWTHGLSNAAILIGAGPQVFS